MKKILFYIIGMLLTFTSCDNLLKVGLDDLPLAEEADIQSFYFEYRFESKNVNGFPQMEIVTLTRVKQNINKENGTIEYELGIPATNAIFTKEIASLVNLTNIVGFCDISDAAIIDPVDGAPQLGVIADWSKPAKYKVTAANGRSKIWTITVIKH